MFGSALAPPKNSKFIKSAYTKEMFVNSLLSLNPGVVSILFFFHYHYGFDFIVLLLLAWAEPGRGWLSPRSQSLYFFWIIIFYY
jgi:hypothetical protein